MWHKSNLNAAKLHKLFQLYNIDIPCISLVQKKRLSNKYSWAASSLFS